MDVSVLFFLSFFFSPTWDHIYLLLLVSLRISCVMGLLGSGSGSGRVLGGLGFELAFALAAYLGVRWAGETWSAASELSTALGTQFGSSSSSCYIAA